MTEKRDRNDTPFRRDAYLLPLALREHMRRVKRGEVPTVPQQSDNR